MAARTVRVKIGQRWYTAEVADTSTSPIKVVVDGETFLVEMDGATPSRRSSPTAPPATAPTTSSPTPLPPAASDDRVLRSPMPGKVLSVSVKVGDTVSPGDELCVLEAMKMHQSIRFSSKGRVARLHIEANSQVSTGDLLAELE